MSGKIIIIEGPDFVGKTGLAKALTETPDFSPAVYFHCPAGQSEFTQSLYSLLKVHADSIDELTKQYMILASHAENIKAMNALKAEGKIVFADRSYFSMMAYQDIDCYGLPLLEYDLILLLDASEDEILHRRKLRVGNDSLDDYFIKNMGEIKARYQQIFRAYRNRFSKIDTSGRTQEEVYEAAYHAVKTAVTDFIN